MLKKAYLPTLDVERVSIKSASIHGGWEDNIASLTSWNLSNFLNTFDIELLFFLFFSSLTENHLLNSAETKIN